MKLRIKPNTLSGTVDAIPSKSDIHRLLICSVLADVPTHLCFDGSSRDIDATVSCLRAMGADIVSEDGGLLVHPLQRPIPGCELDCGESGSTLRFLLPLASVLCEKASFSGHGRLPARPIADLISVMASRGVTFSGRKLPFTLDGRLSPGVFRLPGDVSSQYISALLMTLPYLEGDSVIFLTSPLESESYVEVTRQALGRFGVRTEPFSDHRMLVRGSQHYRSCGNVTPAGDWSNAAFFLAAGAIGSKLCVRGLSMDSAQGDRKVLELLGRFGAEVDVTSDGMRVSPTELHGCHIDMSDMPDLLPILAVVASCAEGRTELAHAARLRLKESDRLSATATMIRDLGGKVREYPDGLCIEGQELVGGTVDVRQDHRMVMAAAIAASVCKGDVVIDGAEAVGKSYPTFFDDYRMLGGRLDVL